jgi:hypothetical protein
MMLGETYQQVCAEGGLRTNVTYASGWYTFPSADSNHSATYGQFYMNRLQCVVYVGLTPTWHFYNAMGGMYVTAGNRGFQRTGTAPNGMQLFLSYDKAVVAGLKANNLMIVGWTDWKKQYANRNTVSQRAGSKVHHPHIAHAAPPKQQAQQAPPNLGDLWLPAS